MAYVVPKSKQGAGRRFVSRRAYYEWLDESTPVEGFKASPTSFWATGAQPITSRLGKVLKQGGKAKFVANTGATKRWGKA